MVGGWDDRAEHLLNKMDELCPDDTHGLGNAIRILAESILSDRQSWRTKEAALLLCEEYAGIIEQRQREQAELDAWADKCEAEDMQNA